MDKSGYSIHGVTKITSQVMHFKDYDVLYLEGRTKDGALFDVSLFMAPGALPLIKQEDSDDS